MALAVALSLRGGYLARMNGTDSSLAEPEWRVTPGLTHYVDALTQMEAHVARMIEGSAGERVWLVEHPACLTAGTSAAREELIEPGRFPVHVSGRGGRFTYHGPGQRVIYPMLDLGRRGRDVRRYVSALEGWAIGALGEFGVTAFTSEAGTGIWVRDGSGQAKIGAIGVRVRRWISFHGLSINVATDLTHYEAIIPCGIAGHGVARLTDFIPSARIADVDKALVRHLPPFLNALSGVNEAT